MKLVFAGTPETSVPSLRALLASRHHVAAVITRPDAAAGRGRAMRSSPVAELAQESNIEILRPRRPSEPQFLERLHQIAPDCVPIVAYGALIGREALDVPPLGWVNLHFSVLPAWRGAAPVQRAIMAGDEITGATVFSLVEELDAGPILGTLTERIGADDTAGSLLGRLADAGSALVVDALDHIEDGDISPVAQPVENASYAPKLTTAEAHIDWGRAAYAIDRHIRGCTPAPGAWTTLNSERIKLGPVAATRDNTLAPGLVAAGKREVRVGTATTDVILGEVQAKGKKVMAAADWARGARLSANTILGDHSGERDG